MGPAVIGFIGSDQSYFTAMGPDVNLAARLCSRAANNEIVLGSRVWHTLQHVLTGWHVEMDVFNDLKGFDGDISAVRLKPRGISSHGRVCCVCSQPLSVMKNTEGFIDLMCPSQHPQDSDQTSVPGVLRQTG
jgi:hypothetical protein